MWRSFLLAKNLKAEEANLKIIKKNDGVCHHRRNKSSVSLVYLLIKQGTLQWIEAPAFVTRKVTVRSIISLCETLIYISHLESESSAWWKSQLTPVIRESLMSPNVATAELVQLEQLFRYRSTL